LVALEALAPGTPVVATKVGAMQSIIRQGETGIVVNKGSPSSLAGAIETFILNTPSAEAIRASVLEYRWAKVAADILEEYVTVVKQSHVLSSFQRAPLALQMVPGDTSESRKDGSRSYE
jgi:glycosyltransferase involved in cell wall biosynthesis